EAVRGLFDRLIARTSELRGVEAVSMTSVLPLSGMQIKFDFRIEGRLQLNYQLIYRDSGCILLNCFALGPWATGMNVSMSLVDVGILKSIGPDQKKLENSLELFGSDYRYLVFGYPPFIKSFVDTTHLDLKKFRMDLIVGGEGISEPLRTHLLQYFQTAIS